MNDNFEQGEIYAIDDKKLEIPDVKVRDLKPSRPVVVVYNHSLNSNPLYPRVLVAPMSSRTDLKRVMDLTLDKGTDGVVQDSLLRLDLVQPVLKADLRGPKGRLSDSAINKMCALIIHLLGVSMDEPDGSIEESDEGGLHGSA